MRTELIKISPLKILIVDDEPATIEFISSVLKHQGFCNIDSLCDAREVIAHVRQNAPDLLILDLRMPHLDGFEVLRQLRKVVPPEEYLPVLIVTSDNQQGTHQQAISEGATDFLAKPLNAGEIVLRVSNLLRARWQHLQLQAHATRLKSEMEAHRSSADELGEATARLRALVENLQSGVLVEDENRRIVLTNPRFCELFQIPAPPAALVGADCSQAAEESKLFFAEPASFVRRVGEILARREIVTSEELLLADGRIFERDYVPIFHNADYRGHLWAYRDITARKRDEAELRQSEARKTASLQTALDCIITIDAQGIILEWNRAAEQTFGHKSEEVVGQLVDLIVSPGLHKAHHAGLHRQSTTGEVRILGQRVEVPALHKNGHEFPVEIAVARIDTPGGPQYTGFLRDISERKRFEQELAQARDVALETARLKAAFLANMSHEIRTPINGVIGMLELLEATPLTGEQNNLLQTALTSADTLLDIINDVLDFSKIEAGKLTIEDGVYAPRDILEECIMVVAGAAHEKSLELVACVDDDVPALVRGDGLRVRQVLTNFLSNAVKFTERGEIVARVTRDLPLTLRFTVADTGVGIASEVVPRLFQPFMQADGSTTRRFGGTGLGLAISKQLIQLMDGEVGLESATGQGSSFWFTLPLRLAPHEELRPHKERRVPVALSKARILVVEDNATAREILQSQLNSWHISNSGAANLGEALRQLREAAERNQPFDGVLLDAQLPHETALELAAQLASEAALRSPRLLLMSSFSPSVEISALAAVMLTKPVRPSLLFDAFVALFRDADTVPVKPKPAEAQHALPEPQAGSGIRVLVADDNAINREVALRWLKKWGYATHPVTNGREAVEALQNEGFNVVLMDCQMPEMDGYEAAKAIRQLSAPARHVPIIALTAHALEGDRQRCLDAGMDDYLAKPIRPALLADAVARWQNQMSTASLGTAHAAQSAASPEMDVLEQETLEELRDLLGDDDLREMIASFIAQRGSYRAAMQNAVISGDAVALAKAAHSLKGAARQLGAAFLAATCEKLEKSAKNADLADANAAVSAVERAWEQSELAFCQMLNS